MLEIGSRRRNQPAPPFAVFEALTQPHRDPTRPRMVLLDDEQEPRIVNAIEPERVIWSSLWIRYPEATMQIDLPPCPDGGTDLRWTLFVQPPAPSISIIGHMRKRLNTLISANLRYTFGQ
jgi:hypothetical protein